MFFFFFLGEDGRERSAAAFPWESDQGSEQRKWVLPHFFEALGKRIKLNRGGLVTGKRLVGEFMGISL